MADKPATPPTAVDRTPADRWAALSVTERQALLQSLGNPEAANVAKRAWRFIKTGDKAAIQAAWDAPVKSTAEVKPTEPSARSCPATRLPNSKRGKPPTKKPRSKKRRRRKPPTRKPQRIGSGTASRWLAVIAPLMWR